MLIFSVTTFAFPTMTTYGVREVMLSVHVYVPESEVVRGENMTELSVKTLSFSEDVISTPSIAHAAFTAAGNVIRE